MIVLTGAIIFFQPQAQPAVDINVTTAVTSSRDTRAWSDTFSRSTAVSRRSFPAVSAAKPSSYSAVLTSTSQPTTTSDCSRVHSVAGNTAPPWDCATMRANTRETICTPAASAAIKQTISQTSRLTVQRSTLSQRCSSVAAARKRLITRRIWQSTRRAVQSWSWPKDTHLHRTIQTICFDYNFMAITKLRPWHSFASRDFHLWIYYV